MSARRGTIKTLRTLPFFLALLVLCAGMTVITGCKNSSHLAPIDQLGQPPDYKLHYHTVSGGESLYAIAWRYGMDYQQLARLNNIHPPYTIHKGQKLKIDSDSGNVSAPVQANTQGIGIPDSSEGVHEIKTSQAPNSVKSITRNSSTANTVAVKPEVERNVKLPDGTLTPTNKAWIWPSKGALISSFSTTDPLRKGIDLGGKLGEPVCAAANGTVVYAGSGLAGYGQLIIIKHDETFLSAYAHNSKLLIKEGEIVKVGQKIAEIGSSGTDKDKLHFEIRREGKPVDPLQYLPPR